MEKLTKITQKLAKEVFKKAFEEKALLQKVESKRYPLGDIQATYKGYMEEMQQKLQSLKGVKVIENAPKLAIETCSTNTFIYNNCSHSFVWKGYQNEFYTLENHLIVIRYTESDTLPLIRTQYIMQIWTFDNLQQFMPAKEEQNVNVQNLNKDEKTRYNAIMKIDKRLTQDKNIFKPIVVCDKLVKATQYSLTWTNDFKDCFELESDESKVRLITKAFETYSNLTKSNHKKVFKYDTFSNTHELLELFQKAKLDGYKSNKKYQNSEYMVEFAKGDKAIARVNLSYMEHLYNTIKDKYVDVFIGFAGYDCISELCNMVYLSNSVGNCMLMGVHYNTEQIADKVVYRVQCD